MLSHLFTCVALAQRFAPNPVSSSHKVLPRGLTIVNTIVNIITQLFKRTLSIPTTLAKSYLTNKTDAAEVGETFASALYGSCSAVLQLWRAYVSSALPLSYAVIEQTAQFNTINWAAACLGLLTSVNRWLALFYEMDSGCFKGEVNLLPGGQV